MIQQLMSGSPYFPKFWGTLDLGNELCQAVEFVGCKKTGTGYPLHEPPSLSMCNVVKIAEDIVKGVMEFHDHGLLHNDLKNDNVLLEKRGKRYNAVIIDFGMASTITAPAKMVGVPKELKMAYVHGGEADYIAPEVVLDEQPASIASDVFSVGRILSDMGEIFGGKTEFHTYCKFVIILIFFIKRDRLTKKFICIILMLCKKAAQSE